MASLFAWSEKYGVKIREIDLQHQKLIGMVGKLNEAMSKGKGREALGGILKELVNYTGTHFATEERLMKAHGYPEYQKHKEKHDRMTQKVLDIRKQYEEGKISLTVDVIKYLENWVDRHILGTDMKYAPFLRSKGIQ